MCPFLFTHSPSTYPPSATAAAPFYAPPCALQARRMNKKFLGILLVLGIFAFTVLSTTALPANRNFVAHLSGDNGVPPVETLAQGQVLFRLSENVTMAHIHIGNASMNGPIVVWLYPEAPPAMLIPGRFNGVLAKGTINASDFVGPLGGKTIDDLIDPLTRFFILKRLLF